MDGMDIDTSTSASSTSEESTCETALLNSCETCLESSWSESNNDELTKLKKYVEHERSLGEHIPLIFDRSDRYMSLFGWLSNHWGPFPIHTHLISRIVHDISAALLVLHRLHFSYGPSLSNSIFLDKSFSAHLLMEQPPRVSIGRLALEEDMFLLGGTFYRLVTGKQALFDKKKHVKPMGTTPYLIDQDALKLATKLLNPHSKHRPTVGEVIHLFAPVINPDDTRVITTLL